eukprot:1232014-Amphidinium_carterae.2
MDLLSDVTGVNEDNFRTGYARIQHFYDLEIIMTSAEEVVRTAALLSLWSDFQSRPCGSNISLPSTCRSGRSRMDATWNPPSQDFLSCSASK